MLNQSGITKTSATTRKTILIAPELAFSMSCMVANTGVDAGEDGKKIVKAGTPLAGDLMARDTEFTVFTVTSEEDTPAVTGEGEEETPVVGEEETPVGILLHDVDVTGGTANAQVVVFGFVDVTKLDEDVAATLTAAASELPKITLVK